MKHLMIFMPLLLAVETSLVEKRDVKQVELEKEKDLYPKIKLIDGEKERILENKYENTEDIVFEKRQNWHLKNKWIHKGKERVLEKRRMINQ